MNLPSCQVMQQTLQDISEEILSVEKSKVVALSDVLFKLIKPHPKLKQSSE